jgi:hypothetical protein
VRVNACCGLFSTVSPSARTGITLMNMRHSLLEITGVLLAFVLCGTALHGNNGSPIDVQKTRPTSLTVSVVPAWSGSSGRGISMAVNTIDTFYVLLTNVSTQAQTAFQTSNSWGYYAVSLELRTGDGRVVTITKKPTGFTRNVPSTFGIPPGEQMVYPIKLDDGWEASSPLPIADEEPVDVTVKAVYQVKPTPESDRQNVWTGRVESAEYRFKFRHWSAVGSKR